ncbi:hypothetical protein A9P82_09535 [Arachidicoccus ginsenosidimutans]|uniref:hypothetical protein n=1 Tax=Arachidicoccus sp. BS20 TaxID=1850526 RepID=UPI0007F181D6|nr:hypothetical protein [Arachidicoccus sp. BS20]ANI89509.1 hypothetical protein A9P82_09535 [Arachidicoccus sp. BS20]
MKNLKYFFLSVFTLFIGITQSFAQCALCTKTAQQLGDGPGTGLNKGIIYLMFIPLALIFYIGYRWYKREKMLRAEHRI